MLMHTVCVFLDLDPASIHKHTLKELTLFVLILIYILLYFLQNRYVLNLDSQFMYRVGGLMHTLVNADVTSRVQHKFRTQSRTPVSSMINIRKGAKDP